MLLLAKGAGHQFACIVEDRFPSLRDSGWFGHHAVREVVLNVAKDPRVAECGAADHQSGAVGLLADADDIVCAADVAIADDGNCEFFSDFGDQRPIGFAAVALDFGATVNGECLCAFAFDDVADLAGNDGVVVPTSANLGSHGSAWHGLHHGADDFANFGWIAQHRRAGIHTDHAIRGASEVDVDKVGLQPIGKESCRIGHGVGVGAEDLHPHRALFFGEIDSFPEFWVFTGERIGLHELGDHDVGALFFAELSKYNVCNSRHRSEIERELTVLEPREHAIIELCVKNWE